MSLKTTKIEWVLGFAPGSKRNETDDKSFSIDVLETGRYDKKHGIEIFLFDILALSDTINGIYPDEFKFEETVIDCLNGSLVHELIHSEGNVKHKDYGQESFICAIYKMGHESKYRFLNKIAYLGKGGV